MKLLTVFFGIVYDLVIGDCWQIAAGAVVLLSVGVGMLKMEVLPASLFAAILGVAIIGGAVLVIYLDALAGYRRHIDS